MESVPQFDAQLDQLLDECSKIVKKHIPDSETRLDFESKLYAEGIKDALLLIKSSMPKSGKLKMLDIGCGKGHISLMLASLGFSVSAIEIEETKGEQLEITEKAWQKNMWKDFETTYPNFDVRYQFYDGKKIPFDDKSFDAVLVYAVIEHVDDAREFMGEIARVLKNNSLLFIFRCPRKQAVIEYAAQFLNLPCHDKLVTEEEIVQLLKINGFQKIEIRISDLVPSFPPKNFQNIWNKNFKSLDAIDNFLLKTPLKHFAHHLNVTSHKT